MFNLDAACSEFVQGRVGLAAEFVQGQVDLAAEFVQGQVGLAAGYNNLCKMDSVIILVRNGFIHIRKYILVYMNLLVNMTDDVFR